MLRALWLLPAALSGAEMKLIPSASWDVKDPATEIVLHVRVPPFLIGATEVTQQEYEPVAGANPSHYRGARRPVENVSWWDAIRYANLLSLRERLEACYDLAAGTCDRTRNGYRLPTEAEWDAALGRAPLPKGEALARTARLGPAGTRDREPMLRLIRESGTGEAGSLAANAGGVHDLIGNVWEWCDEWFNPVPRPAGIALAGVERLIKGGSFVSAPAAASAYRSSMAPERRSRFTGFRLARNAPAPVSSAGPGPRSFEPYDRAPAAVKDSTGGLSPLLGPAGTKEEWTGSRRPALLEKWKKLLGAPGLRPFTPSARLVESFAGPDFAGSLMYLQVEPDYQEKIYVAAPAQPAARPMPVVIVPFYDVDTPLGQNLGGRRFMPPSVRAFASTAVQQGYMAVAIRWFGESYGEHYQEAVANLALRHPGCSGLGKWVWDAGRLLDWLSTLPQVDRDRIGIMGHSLGGKMALYAAAMDQRIRAVVFSEGGIGFDFSNYDDYWYFDESIRRRDPATDQHELIALVAPRPFLLIAGNEYDGDKSWPYINAARKVYALFGDPRAAGLFNHGTGHSPSPEAVRLSFDWLDRFLAPR